MLFVWKWLTVMQETQVRPLDGEDPLKKEMATILVLMPGESRWQRILAGYNPWG